MARRFRTQIDSLEPTEIRLARDGRARVRVRGHTLGFVRCGAERRFVWGAFDESFALALPQGAPRVRVAIVAWGLGGRAVRSLTFAPLFDVLPPHPAPRVRRLRWSRPATPRTPTLTPRELRRHAEPTRAAPRAPGSESVHD